MAAAFQTSKKKTFIQFLSRQGFSSVFTAGVIFLIILGPPSPRVTTCGLFLKVPLYIHIYVYTLFVSAYFKVWPSYLFVSLLPLLHHHQNPLCTHFILYSAAVLHCILLRHEIVVYSLTTLYAFDNSVQRTVRIRKIIFQSHNINNNICIILYNIIQSDFLHDHHTFLCQSRKY